MGDNFGLRHLGFPYLRSMCYRRRMNSVRPNDISRPEGRRAKSRTDWGGSKKKKEQEHRHRKADQERRQHDKVVRELLFICGS